MHINVSQMHTVKTCKGYLFFRYGGTRLQRLLPALGAKVLALSNACR